jgi:hypothetical protein
MGLYRNVISFFSEKVTFAARGERGHVHEPGFMRRMTR